MSTREGKATSRAPKRRLGNFVITCKEIKEEVPDSIYKLEVPTEGATLYHGDETIETKIDDFDVLYSIDGGQYGSVVAMTLKSHPDFKFAVKKIGLETSRDREQSTYTDLTTIKNVGTLKYPYVIAYHGAIISKEDSELWICVELMNTSIEKFYRAMNSMTDVTDNQYNQVLWRLIHNITSALHFLKTHRILHRDVKPPNMLVNSECVFKICDFGISRTMRPSYSLINDPHIVGTECYIPPELLTSNPLPYGIRADMWALGLSLFEIISGSNPFTRVPFFGLAEAIRTWQPTFPQNRRFSDDMKELIQALLKKDVDERPKSYMDIINYPSVQAVSIEPSEDEKAFVNHVIDSIPPRYS